MSRKWVAWIVIFELVNPLAWASANTFANKQPSATDSVAEVHRFSVRFVTPSDFETLGEDSFRGTFQRVGNTIHNWVQPKNKNSKRTVTKDAISEDSYRQYLDRVELIASELGGRPCPYYIEDDSAVQTELYTVSQQHARDVERLGICAFAIASVGTIGRNVIQSLRAGNGFRIGFPSLLLFGFPVLGVIGSGAYKGYRSTRYDAIFLDVPGPEGYPIKRIVFAELTQESMRDVLAILKKYPNIQFSNTIRNPVTRK